MTTIDENTKRTADAVTGGGMVTKSKFGDALAEGRAFVADTSVVTVDDTFNVLFENPTADRMATITMIASNSGAEATPEIQVNPTTDLPTTQRGSMNLNSAAGSTTNMNLYADDQLSGMSGGGTDVYLTVTGNYVRRDFPYGLGPGETVGFVTEAGALSTTDVKLAVFYYEEQL